MGSYRKCAGVMVFNAEKKVLVCARNDAKGFNWQFPQGGIEYDENPAEAALRELKEETSICSVKCVKTLSSAIRYDFPDYVLEQASGIGKKYQGQDVYWSLLYFFGSDDEINLNTKEPEFKAYEWIDPQEAVNRIIDFKKDMYEKLVTKMSPLIFDYID